jgi:hypothetical protein
MLKDKIKKKMSIKKKDLKNNLIQLRLTFQTRNMSHETRITTYIHTYKYLNLIFNQSNIK